MTYELLLANAFSHLTTAEREKTDDWLDHVDALLATLRADLSHLEPSNLNRDILSVMLYRQVFTAKQEGEE